MKFHISKSWKLCPACLTHPFLSPNGIHPEEKHMVLFSPFQISQFMCYQTEDVTAADHFTGITGTSVRKMKKQNWTRFLHVRWNSIKMWLVGVLGGQPRPLLHVWLPLSTGLVRLLWGLPLTGWSLTSRQVPVGRVGEGSCHHTEWDSRA